MNRSRRGPVLDYTDGEDTTHNGTYEAIRVAETISLSSSHGLISPTERIYYLVCGMTKWLVKVLVYLMKLKGSWREDTDDFGVPRRSLP